MTFGQKEKMEKDKGKKYQYTYYTATGKEIIEVDENWYEILRQGDRDIYNNNRREEYKSYHLRAFTTWFSIYVYGTIQRNAEVVQIKQNENTKSFVDQSNIYVSEKKANEIKHETVVKQENADKKQDKYDAKEKGNNEYQGNNNKKRKKQEEGKVTLKQSKSFDVKI